MSAVETFSSVEEGPRSTWLARLSDFIPAQHVHGVSVLDTDVGDSITKQKQCQKDRIRFLKWNRVGHTSDEFVVSHDVAGHLLRSSQKRCCVCTVGRAAHRTLNFTIDFLEEQGPVDLPESNTRWEYQQGCHTGSSVEGLSAIIF